MILTIIDEAGRSSAATTKNQKSTTIAAGKNVEKATTKNPPTTVKPGKTTAKTPIVTEEAGKTVKVVKTTPKPLKTTTKKSVKKTTKAPVKKTTTAPKLSDVDALTQNSIKWLFSFYSQNQVKNLITSLSTLACTPDLTISAIERSLATEAIQSSTDKQLQNIQDSITIYQNETNDKNYQVTIATFFDNMFSPFLSKTISMISDAVYNDETLDSLQFKIISYFTKNLKNGKEVTVSLLSDKFVKEFGARSLTVITKFKNTLIFCLSPLMTKVRRIVINMKSLGVPRTAIETRSITMLNQWMNFTTVKRVIGTLRSRLLPTECTSLYKLLDGELVHLSMYTFNGTECGSALPKTS
uniref:Uncharacterized protein n=1 Tax=Panagrolaimus sp. JU765 TaxID=591449 RepID=A0AC34QCF4_9BILA